MQNLHDVIKVLITTVVLTVVTACATSPKQDAPAPAAAPEAAPSPPPQATAAEPVPAPVSEPKTEIAKPEATTTYTVVRGDNLWNIAAYPVIYGNPYEWPLIYKANADQIKDADLIYPNQVLAIPRNSSASEIEAAVEHAKTRGEWSLGAVEQTDIAYLRAGVVAKK
jgi:nucleoid-associated protein YgaU